MPQTKTVQKWSLASVELRDAYTDFMLSRQAMNCTPSTLEFYRYTAGKFLEWSEGRGITAPQEVTARYVREYIAELVSMGKKDTTVWDHARAIKTMLSFWHKEGYTPSLVKFELPKLAKKRLSVLTAEELRQIVKACNVRDRGIVLWLSRRWRKKSSTTTLAPHGAEGPLWASAGEDTTYAKDNKVRLIGILPFVTFVYLVVKKVFPLKTVKPV